MLVDATSSHAEFQQERFVMQIQKILVVDDSPTERYFYADLLTRSGYTVVTAENGEEANAERPRTTSRS